MEVATSAGRQGATARATGDGVHLPRPQQDPPLPLGDQPSSDPRGEPALCSGALALVIHRGPHGHSPRLFISPGSRWPVSSPRQQLGLEGGWLAAWPGGQ